MPKLPVPNDWNGKDWFCTEVQWPKSDQYLGLLMGFLSYLTRGRAYDEKTGNIRDAQAIGWQIFERNMQLKPCTAEQEQPEIPSPGDWPCDWSYSGMCEDECEGGCEDMSGCCIVKLRWMNGNLEYLRCGEWEIVEGDVVLPPQPADETITPITDPVEQADMACSKAQAIIDYFWQVCDMVLDFWQEPGLTDKINNELGLDLSWRWIAYAQTFAFATDAIELDQFIMAELTSANKEALICQLSKRLDGSNNDIGENQTAIIEDTIESFWTFTANPLMDTFSTDIYKAFGRENWRRVTRNSAQFYNTEPCCPPESEISTDFDWSHEVDFTEGNAYGWSLNGTGVQLIAGQGVVVTPAAYGDRLAGVQKALPTPAAEGFNFTFLQVEFSAWPQGSGATSYWFKLGPDVLYSDNSMYGKPKVSLVTDKQVSQGQPIEIAWNSTLGNPPSGSHKLTRIVYAGKGTDPWPTDPPYQAKG